MTKRFNTAVRLQDVDAKLAKQIAGKLRVYGDGEKIHVLHFKSGAQCSLPATMAAAAVAIGECLIESQYSYMNVVPMLRKRGW